MARIELVVNGESSHVDVDPERGLLYVLREELGLTGSKYGCGEGQCGACTVLIDGTATRSCITSVETAAGKKITTIEGLEENGVLHRLQEAFLHTGALQCGYCTPGMIVSGAALLKENPDPTRQEIVAYMDGNVCRCGAYPRIISAIRHAAEEG
jgi:isoquinoline 1-oxidoreductase alpha subunit